MIAADYLVLENYSLPLAAADVCLVSMPYCDPEKPSLALGLLQSVLLQGGIETRSIYANLMFCEELGPNLYIKSHPGNPFVPIAEWTFASAAFPEFQTDDNVFINELYNKFGWATKQSLDEYREEMLSVRRKAERFTTFLAKQILSLSPRIVGCSSSLSQRVPSLALLKKIREIDPQVITLMGGADCETVMGRATHQYFPWVDYVVSGEGEDLIVPLINGIFKFGRQMPIDALPEGVLAPLHRRFGYPGGKDGKLPRAAADSFMKQMIPVYGDYFDTLRSLPLLSEAIRPSLPIQASRGCWHGKCKFCGLNPSQIPYRSRPAEGVLAELQHLNLLYGIDHFEFLDNILDMRCFDDLIPELVRGGYPYKLFFELRSNLSKEQFKMLREAGVVWCQPGIESLHSKSLKAMRKGVTSWQNIQTLKWCCQFGIRVTWQILANLTEDQDSWYQEMAELVPLLTHLYPPMGVGTIYYQRNSYYFEHAEEYALKLRCLPLDDYVFPLSTQEMANLSYTFEDEFIDSTENDPAMALLFDRPGLRKLRLAAFQWSVAAISSNRPVLNMKVSEEEIIVRDTRPVAVAPSICLNGVQRELYLACDQAVKETRLYEMLSDRGFKQADVEFAIKNLLDNKLLIRVDQRLMALAVEEPYLEYIPLNENPFGYLDHDCNMILGHSVEFIKPYINDMVNRGLLDRRYLPDACLTP